MKRVCTLRKVYRSLSKVLLEKLFFIVLIYRVVFYDHSVLFVFIISPAGRYAMEWKGNSKYLHEKKFFSILLSPKMEVRLTLDSKKAISNFKKRLFRTSKEPYLIMGRMLLKLRPDVAVTASGRSCCYVVT